MGATLRPNTMLSRFLALAVAAAFAAGCSSIPGRTEFLVTGFGAVGDGMTSDTASIQRAIDHCAANGGGVVVVPEGRFLTGSLFLKPGVDLRVDRGGVVLGSLDKSEYPRMQTRWEGIEREWTAALINAVDLHGTTVSGEGTIDGQGQLWEAREPRPRGERLAEIMRSLADKNSPAEVAARTGPFADPSHPWQGRPRLMVFLRCKDVAVSGLRLQNQASWGLVFIYCQQVLASGLTIRAEDYIPSSDGIDVDSCRDVRIDRCDIHVQDDCISLKAGRDEDGLRVNRPCENILIENCRFGYGHGAVALGSETSGFIRNVEVRDCVVEDDNWAAIRIKSAPARGGGVENVVYRNIELRGVKQAIEVNAAWSGPRNNSSKGPPVFRNIRLVNVYGKATQVGTIRGLNDQPVERIRFEDCRITAGKGLSIARAQDIDTSGLQATVEKGPAVVWEDRK